jgi:DMSO/TMAO reductase YedYZ molybdopterin-dependent catalytic subunit
VVDGFVQHSLNLSLNELKTMPKTRVNAAIYCVNQPDVAVASGNWTGIALRYILLEAGVTSEAIKIAFYAKTVSNYTFTTDLTLEAAMRDDVIVAYERDNTPLNETLRLVVPGKWGYKWISELIRIEVTNYNFLGTFESHGYPDEADITD